MSNTGPLSALALLDLLHLFGRFYGDILVPPAVMKELAQGPGAALRLRRISEQSSIRECPLSQPIHARLLAELHGGEAEVFALAQERRARLVIIDEALGREYARVLDLSVTGTVGILVRARREGLIEVLRPALVQLRLGRYRLSDRLVDWALKSVSDCWGPPGRDPTPYSCRCLT